MRRKRVAIAGVVVLLILAGVVVALPWLVDVNQYRDRVQTALQERLNRDVSIGRMQLSLWPIGVRIESVVIGEDPALQMERPFARVQQFYVSPALLPLLTGRFELRAVELHQPIIELVRMRDGDWNVSSLGTNDAPDEEPSTLALGRLVVSAGQVAITDLQGPGPGTRAVYDNIDVRLDNFTPDRPFDVTLAVTMPGEGTQRLTARGRGGPVAQEALATTPFDGTIDLDDVSISGAQRFLQLEALEGTDAVISGRATLGNAGGRLSSTGSLRLDDTRVRGVAIGYPIAADFDMAHDTTTGVLTIASGELRLDRTPLSLAGTVRTQEDPAQVDVRVTATDASLAEAARLASAFGLAFGTGTEVEGMLTADVRARGAVSRPALEGQARLRDVSVSGRDVPQPVRADAVEVTLTPTEIRTGEITIRTGQTSVGVRAAISRYTTPTPSVDVRLRTTDADVGEVLAVARAWGVEAAGGTTGTGRLTVDVQASGPMDAPTYSGGGRLTGATLETPALTQPLRVRSARLAFARDAATLEGLAASVGATNAEGRLTVRNFTSPEVQFQLSADTIDVIELQRLLSPVPPAADAPPPTASGDSLLHRVTGSGTVRVGTIVYGALRLEQAQADVTLDRGLIRLDPVAAMLFGGRHRGAITMDARTSPAAVAVASDIEQVDANQLASAVSSLDDVIHGALGSRLRLGFTADGGDRIARSLNGTMSLDLAEGRIANMNLVQEIANIARFAAGQARAERSTQVAGLSGTFTLTDGVARTDDLTASIEQGTLAATGTVNLADERLDLRLTAVLSREFSERVGGTRAGGFLTTALANQQGELVVPMIVTGTTAQPRFAPDVQRVADMKLRNLVPSLRDPQGLTSRVLGAVGGQRDDSRTAGERIGDLVGAISGRRAEPSGEAKEPASKDDAKAPADTPERPPATNRLQDALRGLLGGREKPAPPTEPTDKEEPAEQPK
jgi:uncharacterized protein involved in outer membrane biogenesis